MDDDTKAFRRRVRALEVEALARYVMGWVGSKPVPLPNTGVAPEDATFDAWGGPVTGTYPFFDEWIDGGIFVFVARREPGRYWNPFTNFSDMLDVINVVRARAGETLVTTDDLLQQFLPRSQCTPAAGQPILLYLGDWRYAIATGQFKITGFIEAVLGKDPDDPKAMRGWFNHWLPLEDR